MSTEDPAFKSGDTCYDIQGNECVYVAAFESRHTIAMCHYGEDGDGPYHGEVFVADRVFASPPLQKRHDECARLDGLIAGAKKTLRDLEDEIRKANRDMNDTLQRIKGCDELANIDRFLAGEITHFVIDRGNSETVVETLSEALHVDSDRDKYVRLLSLYGDASRKFTWAISSYGDGSGSIRNCIPAISREDAYEKAIQMHKGKLPKLRTSWCKINHPYVYTTWAECAAKLGVAIPDDIAELQRKVKLSRATKDLEEKKAQLETAKCKLIEAQSALDAELGVSND